jgi:hypothetical protein
VRRGRVRRRRSSSPSPFADLRRPSSLGLLEARILFRRLGGEPGFVAHRFFFLRPGASLLVVCASSEHAKVKSPLKSALFSCLHLFILLLGRSGTEQARSILFVPRSMLFLP